MTDAPRYRHTQTSPLSALLIALAMGMLVWAWAMRAAPSAAVIIVLAAAVIAGSAGCIFRLTISGEESGLRLQFGPLPLFHVQIAYDDMQSAEAARSSILDGWGIHYVPGRGWTYNIWGFDCVLIGRKDKSPIRVGTNDVDGLVAFLSTRIVRDQDSIG